MQEWEKKQKHHDDCRQVLKDTGCMDSQGRVRRFRGQAAFDALKAKGHTAFTYEDCDCGSR